ncbi:DMT family transporter [Nocardioides ferulae]|uniref:DMT family transporter n=1 Tax=Nocardioides ferulae TaxID=2340821 RepID=UPI000EABAC11|nr:EamA family transporter [Nocardioides ferulae]
MSSSSRSSLPTSSVDVAATVRDDVRRARLGLLQICAAGALWGTGGLAVSLLQELSSMSVLTVSTYRLAIASAVLLVALVIGRRLPELPRLVRERPREVLLVGASTATYQVLYFAAVVLAGVTVATVVSLALAPLLLTVVDAVRDRRSPRPSTLVVLACALTGLVLVSLSAGATGTGPRPTLGILAAVGSGTAYALTTARGHALSQRAGPLAITTATTSVGAVVLLPLGLAAGLSGSPLVSAEPEAWAILGYLGVLTMALPYGLLYAGLRTTPGSAAVVATLLEPVTAALLAAAILGERVGPLGLLGALLILAAVGGVHRRPSLDAVPPG